MGKKMAAISEKPEAVLVAFTSTELCITLSEFVKFCFVEFALREDLAKQLFEVVVRCCIGQQLIKFDCVSVSVLINLINPPNVHKLNSKNYIHPAIP